METITSKNNAKVKELGSLLRQKKAREETGLFACEGLRLCLDAVKSGVPLRRLFLTRQAAQKYPEAEGLVQAAQESLFIPEELARKVADTRTPQGVFGICARLDNGKSAVTIKNGGRYLLAQSLQDPGNLGSILRSAEAFAVDGIFLSSDCPDLYGSKVLRGSMGGVFRLPVEVSADLGEIVSRLREQGISVYAAALGGDSVSLQSLEKKDGAAVLIGNEGNGLPDELIEMCDSIVTIPMQGSAESLNAAAAATVLMWEMCGRKLKIRD